MSTTELRKRLIEQIHSTQDEGLLEEIYRLLIAESEDLEIYKLSPVQLHVAEEARNQIQKGHFLTDEQATKEIDEWLDE